MSLVPADVSIDGLKNPRINTAIHWRSWILSPDTHSTVHPFRLGKKHKMMMTMMMTMMMMMIETTR